MHEFWIPPLLRVMLLPSSPQLAPRLAIGATGIPGQALLLLTAVPECIPGLLPAVPRQVGSIRLW